MRILIAEDHLLVREAIKKLLLDWDPGIRLAECWDAAGLWNAARDDPQADVLLVNPGIPGLAGGDAMGRLRACFPAARIGVFSVALEPAEILELLRRGASGFIPKTATAAETLQALTVLAAGGQYLPPPCALSPPSAERNAGGAMGERDRQHAIVRRLSPRQEEVMRLLADGHPNKTIARELGVSVGTVKTHLVQIFQILGVRNRTSAVLAAGNLRTGLLQ
jgi:DNA-binding NarL/FixJ family response regulator